MLELIEKVYFAVDNYPEKMADYLADGIVTLGSGGASKDSIDWDTYFFTEIFLESNSTIISIKNDEFYNHLQSFLSIQTADEYVNFILKKGIYYVPGSFAPPLSFVPNALFALDVIKTINEIKENLALIESNRRSELDKKFKWSLRNTTYEFNHWPLALTDSYFKRHKKYTDEFNSYKQRNVFLLPDEISPNDYRAAVNYVSGMIINIYLEPVIFILSTHHSPFSFTPIVPNYMEFIWHIFVDTLVSGIKYKLCVSCGKIFLVENKPGREPSVCSGTCRSRKSRRKQNERSY